jgi:hypothetical protein
MKLSTRGRTTRGIWAGLAATAALLGAHAASAADYVAIVQSIDVNKPADVVWKKVGGFCAIHDWMGGVPCTYTSGDGGVGTNRLIAGRINEVMVAQTDLSYAYAQPLVPNMYHGSVEVRPVSPTTSKIVYTILYDAAPLADQAAKDKSRNGYSMMFMGALKKMKAMAEAQ